MKIKHLLVIVFLCFAVNGWSQSATQLLIKVELPDGSPVMGVKIQLLQLERSFTRNFLCGMTDNRGEFNIHFEAEASKDDKHYGWGIYRFVLMPEDPHAADFYYSFEYDCPVVSTDQCEYCSAVAPYFTTVATNKVNGKSAIVVYHKRIPLSVSVSVIDKVTKLPIAGAAINVIMTFGSAAMGGPPIGMTDSNGHFKTDRLFTEHVLFLHAYKDGYRDDQFDMKNFQPGAAYVLELQAK